MYRDCYSYGIGYQQGYQKTGPVQSTVTTKLKGAWRYNGSYGDYTHNCGGYVGNTTFDEADYVIPPQVKINLLHMYYWLLISHCHPSYWCNESEHCGVT